MPTYVLPQVLVFQDFSTVPAAQANPLRAHISGPHAQLIRHAQDSEREQGDLGYYDRLLDSASDWPGRPAGGKVDESYVKVWMQDALLHYFEDLIGGGSRITKVPGYNNRVRSDAVNFAANAHGARDGTLGDRDVRAGDVARVRAITGAGQSVTLWTYVKGLISDKAATTLSPAAADVSNPAAQPAGTFVAKVSGPINAVTATADGAAYDGLTSGNITETYDLVVLDGSVNGDFTKATLRVLSGSGTDDQASLTPAARGQPTVVGSRNLRVTFDVTPNAATSASAHAEGVSPDDLVAGQRWQVTVGQAFTPAVPTSGGTYTGAQDTTYIVTVSRGGLYTAANKPQVKVSTTNGVDLAGPVAVNAAGQMVPVGTMGVTMSWAGTGLRAGDRFYADVTGTQDGPLRTVELGHNLDVNVPDDSEVDLTLFIRKPLLQVPKNHQGAAPLTNWDTSDTQLTVHAGVVAYDEGWTVGGQQQPLAVWSEPSRQYGRLFVDVRYWLPDLAQGVGTIQDVADINARITGPLDPDNPLKWGVFKALENSNGSEVKYTAVTDPDDDAAWADVLESVLGRDDVYGLVPLTRRRTVLDLYAAHCKSQSSPEEGLWRVLWASLSGMPDMPVVAAGSDVTGHTEASTSDGKVALAVVGDDPQSAGTQFTILRCTSANADFLRNEVRPGDIVRLLYTSDGFGEEAYSEYVVDEVQSEDQLRLLSGPDAPVTVASKFEVWRNLSPDEEARQVAVAAGSWGDRRVRAVWPDKVESSGTVMEGYFLCASLAGLASGILPHQGMTNLEVVGYTGVGRTTSKFSRGQLNTLAGAGVWVVTQDLTGAVDGVGKVYTRHAVTTGDQADINQREEVLTRNLDSISYRFKDYYRPYIGVTNVTPTIQASLGLLTRTLIDLLQNESATANLGGQLIDATLVSLRPHLTLKDRYVIQIDCEMPYPFNNAEIHLAV